jgi:hypothetical protein
LCRPDVSSAPVNLFRNPILDFFPNAAFNRLMHRKVIFTCLLAVASLGCRDLSNGQSSANETPVADGQVVLVKNGKEVGAFILRNQQFNPEVTDYQWYLRNDGKGTFHEDDAAVTNGVVTSATKISFGTFAIEWSGHSNRSGWVYFSKPPGDFKTAAKFEMCVTTETNVTAVNAHDSRWRYREKPSINMKELYKAQVNRDH